MFRSPDPFRLGTSLSPSFQDLRPPLRPSWFETLRPETETVRSERSWVVSYPDETIAFVPEPCPQ